MKRMGFPNVLEIQNTMAKYNVMWPIPEDTDPKEVLRSFQECLGDLGFTPSEISRLFEAGHLTKQKMYLIPALLWFSSLVENKNLRSESDKLATVFDGIIGQKFGWQGTNNILDELNVSKESLILKKPEHISHLVPFMLVLSEILRVHSRK